MVTAGPPSRMPRVRTPAGPLRVWGLAVVLFAFLYGHGVSIEGAVGHLDSTASAPAVAVFHGHQSGLAAADPDPHHGGDPGAASHPAQECVPGQPQQGPALDAPAAGLLVPAPAPPRCGPGARPSAADGRATAAPPGSPTVLRI
ncbi:hypothetical protein [Streptomyces sp. NPDC002054]|uniref:hypothetical protein n=1 Tax=Streptomyces sp. NPDC002054 TaxID=3154663 RepID=UPI00332893D0